MNRSAREGKSISNGMDIAIYKKNYILYKCAMKCKSLKIQSVGLLHSCVLLQCVYSCIAIRDSHVVVINNCHYQTLLNKLVVGSPMCIFSNRCINEPVKEM